MTIHDKPLILTTGCFHILHPGHIELFEYCSKFGSLVVGINTDEYLLKKSNEIKIKLVDRIYLLNSIKYIDKVIPFKEETASELIEKVHPYMFVKGPDYRNIRIPEQDVCERLNIRFHIATQIKKYNSSDFLKL